jgi:hypothetical protein
MGRLEMVTRYTDDGYRWLHSQWRAGVIASACCHLTAAALYAKCAASPLRTKAGGSSIAESIESMIEHSRRKSAVLSLFETAHSVTSFMLACQDVDSWIASNGHVDYITAIVDGLLDEFCHEEVDDDD